ncbi:glycosyltransferase [Pedobacter sp. UBA4863]|uniref:glycosyltransferase family 2 protein n=1 Tax=Pedobacter sp. UBA4863 TaxID=1947060 RepID=UPI0025E4754E|nr:glycosyltransferase [Pedobacter sp. UBA4863]
MPLISVIVTTYNRRELLAETLSSILNQTFQDFELIVVDNFSDYDFFSHIESFNSSKIKAYQNNNEGIIAANRNYGLTKRSGDFIAFCDDDDIWLPNKLEKQIEVFKANEKAKQIIYTEVILFGSDTKQQISNRKSIRNINQLIKRNQIALSSTLISYSDVISFDEDPTLTACEDFYLWLTLVKNGYSLVYIEDPLIKYRVNSNSAYNKDAHLSHIKTIHALVKYTLKFGFRDVKVSSYIYVIYRELFKFYLKNLIAKFRSNA